VVESGDGLPPVAQDLAPGGGHGLLVPGLLGGKPQVDLAPFVGAEVVGGPGVQAAYSEGAGHHPLGLQGLEGEPLGHLPRQDPQEVVLQKDQVHHQKPSPLGKEAHPTPVGPAPQGEVGHREVQVGVGPALHHHPLPAQKGPHLPFRGLQGHGLALGRLPEEHPEEEVFLLGPPRGEEGEGKEKSQEEEGEALHTLAPFYTLPPSLAPMLAGASMGPIGSGTSFWDPRRGSCRGGALITAGSPPAPPGGPAGTLPGRSRGAGRTWRRGRPAPGEGQKASGGA
jgi:hypothetical protein